MIQNSKFELLDGMKMIQRNLKGLLLLLFSLQTINIYAYLRFHEGRLLKVGKCRWGESLRLEEDSRSLEETRAWWSSSQISSLRTNQSWAKELVGAFALGTFSMNRGNVSEENIRYTGQFYHQLLDPSIQDFELSLADVGSTMIFTYAWMLSQQLHHNTLFLIFSQQAIKLVYVFGFILKVNTVIVHII